MEAVVASRLVTVVPVRPSVGASPTPRMFNGSSSPARCGRPSAITAQVKVEPTSSPTTGRGRAITIRLRS